MAFWLSSYCLLSLLLAARANLGKKERNMMMKGRGVRPWFSSCSDFRFLVLIISRGGCLQYRRDTMLRTAWIHFSKSGNSFLYASSNNVLRRRRGKGGKKEDANDEGERGWFAEWVSYLKCHFSKVILSWSTENDDGFKLTFLLH